MLNGCNSIGLRNPKTWLHWNEDTKNKKIVKNRRLVILLFESSYCFWIMTMTAMITIWITHSFNPTLRKWTCTHFFLTLLPATPLLACFYMPLHKGFDQVPTCGLLPTCQFYQTYKTLNVKGLFYHKRTCNYEHHFSTKRVNNLEGRFMECKTKFSGTTSNMENIIWEN